MAHICIFVYIVSGIRVLKTPVFVITLFFHDNATMTKNIQVFKENIHKKCDKWRRFPSESKYKCMLQCTFKSLGLETFLSSIHLVVSLYTYKCSFFNNFVGTCYTQNFHGKRGDNQPEYSDVQAYTHERLLGMFCVSFFHTHLYSFIKQKIISCKNVLRQ